MAKLILKFDLRNQTKVDLNNTISDLSGNGNNGIITYLGGKYDKSLGLFIPGNSFIRVNNKDLIKPLKDYSIRCVCRKVQQSEFGPTINIVTNRANSGLFPYFTFYQPGSTNLALWNYGSGGIVGPSVNLSGVTHNYSGETDFDFRIIIDGTNSKATLTEALQDKTFTDTFSNTLAGDLGFIKIFNIGSGQSWWLQQIEIYEGVYNFKDLTLILDNNHNVYTINGNGNLEVIANEFDLVPNTFETYGKPVSEYTNIKDKLQIDNYKIITLQKG